MADAGDAQVPDGGVRGKGVCLLKSLQRFGCVPGFGAGPAHREEYDGACIQVSADLPFASTHTYTHLHTHTCIHMYIRTYLHTCVQR